MEPDPQKVSERFFDTDVVEYDPLMDVEIDDDDLDQSDGQQGPNTEVQAKMFYAPRPDNRSAEQRIEDLFADMATRRRVLLDILGFLDTPKRSDALDARVNELQEHDTSVYTGYNYSVFLSEAGAIAKVDKDGLPFDEKAEQQPDIVEINGAKFYKPTDGKQVFWLTTSEGRAYLESDDPFGRLKDLLAAEPQYLKIYQRLLEFCDNERGRASDELAELIDGDPLVQTPRKYFSYFAKKLEDSSALSWSKKWRTTEHGSQALKLLFEEGSGCE